MPRGITQDQVNQAADAIIAAGERPTVEKVRQQLGTGSPNTVTRMLDVWRQGLSERLRQASLLPELPDEVGQAMTALWTHALQHARAQAQQELQAEREGLQRAGADLDAALLSKPPNSPRPRRSEPKPSRPRSLPSAGRRRSKRSKYGWSGSANVGNNMCRRSRTEPTCRWITHESI